MPWIRCGLAVLIASLFGLAASAQTACEASLARAQALYISGAFEEVEEILEPCVQPGRMGEDNRVWAYRLLALTALQEGRLIEAKLVALSLLNLRPGYQPDPVLDPPSYSELVQTVRSQLEVVRPPRRPDADTTPVAPQPVGPEPIGPVTNRQPVMPIAPLVFDAPARGRRTSGLELSLWSGNVTFSGDIDRNDVLDDYLISDGPRLGLQASYVPAPWVALGLSAEGLRIEKFPVERRTFQRVGRRVAANVGIATLDMRMRAWPGAVLSPYLSLGGSVLVGRVDDVIRVAGGPSAALGVDVGFTRRVSLFAEGTGTMPFPRQEFDGSSDGAADLFSGFRAGLRTRIGR